MFEFCNESDQIRQVPPQPVQSPHNERIALAQAFEAAFELRPVGVLARGVFFVDLAAFGTLQCIPLQVEGLL